jgi:hypothetical protein
MKGEWMVNWQELLPVLSKYFNCLIWLDDKRLTDNSCYLIGQ